MSLGAGFSAVSQHVSLSAPSHQVSLLVMLRMCHFPGYPQLPLKIPLIALSPATFSLFHLQHVPGTFLPHRSCTHLISGLQVLISLPGSFCAVFLLKMLRQQEILIVYGLWLFLLIAESLLPLRVKILKPKVFLLLATFPLVSELSEDCHCIITVHMTTGELLGQQTSLEVESIFTKIFGRNLHVPTFL